MFWLDQNGSMNWDAISAIGTIAAVVVALAISLKDTLKQAQARKANGKVLARAMAIRIGNMEAFLLQLKHDLAEEANKPKDGGALVYSREKITKWRYLLENLDAMKVDEFWFRSEVLRTSTQQSYALLANDLSALITGGLHLTSENGVKKIDRMDIDALREFISSAEEATTRLKNDLLKEIRFSKFQDWRYRRLHGIKKNAATEPASEPG